MAKIKGKTKGKTENNINNHILDVITPPALEFHESNFWFGEKMARTITITGYPPKVKIGWLSRIANMDGVTCSMHLAPADSVKLIDNINQSMGELNSKINNGGSAVYLKRATQQYNDADALLEKIDQEQENVFYVTVAIMIMGNDKEDLELKYGKVISAIAGSKMRGRSLMFKQEEGLLAVSPYGILPQDIKDIASRNMPVSTIAGAYPFNYAGLNDGKGYIFGKDASGGVVILDAWKRGGDRTNSNWTVLGPPGVGKSTAIKHIFTNEYSQGTKIIIIDPEREYKELCENLGGQWINCGGGKGGRINPLQVKEIPKDDDGEEEPLYKDEGKGLGALALHFQTLRTFFKLYVKDIDTREYALLELALEELYFKHGITWDTDIKTIKNEQYPIMKDLYDFLLEKAEDKSLPEKRRTGYDDLALLLRSCAVGADSSLWNGHTTIEANSDFIVLDTWNLQDADETIKSTQYFNVLTWAWQQLSVDREEQVLLGVDEAYLLVDPNVPQTLQFLRNVSKRIRKYMGGLAVISHSAVDFLDPAVKRYGQALLDNPCFKFFMGSDGQDLEELSKLMKLTEEEVDKLSKKNRGEGLLIAGSKRLYVNIELADHELELFGKGGGK